MKLTLTFFLAASVALAGFMPNVRVDHEERPCWSCESPAIAVGPGAPSSQPLYVVFQDESLYMGVRDDIMFQKSTDAGRTWLPADVLIRRGSRSALNPDITTDSDGNVYIVYEEDSAPSSRVYCVRSSDGGATWTAPTRVDDHTSGGGGSGRIVADSAGRLFVAWNHGNPDDCHIFSSVSTDRGATWSPSVRVCDDTVPYGCYSSDVSVQPGTNHYLVAATAPRYEPPLHSLARLPVSLHRHGPDLPARRPTRHLRPLHGPAPRRRRPGPHHL